MRLCLSGFKGILPILLLGLCIGSGAVMAQTASQSAVISFLTGSVYLKSPSTACEPRFLAEGEACFLLPSVVGTASDGQFIFEAPNLLEVRLKEDTQADILRKTEYKINAGMAGFAVFGPGQRVGVKTKHLKAILSEGKFVVKTNPYLTRLCVVKGAAIVCLSGLKQPQELKAGYEIAAADEKLSLPYKYTDDLRFAWYWVKPQKEPSLSD